MFYRFMYSVFFVNILRVIFIINSFFSSKVRKALFGRFGLWRRYRKNIPQKGNKKRIWFHVSSVGEMEQARPVIRKLIEKRSDKVEIVLTYFSPSAKAPASRLEGIIFRDYLPLDTYFNVKKAFRFIQPDLVVFVKFDIWPNIIWEAKQRVVSTAMIDGTLQRRSMRYSNLLGQAFYNSVYMGFDLIGTVSESDYNRFLITAPKHKNVKMLGDTRYDQVAFRAKNAANTKKLPDAVNYYKDKFTIICGSTWEGDDNNILLPLRMLLDSDKTVNLIMVPHEPSEKRVSNYLNYFLEFAPRRLKDIRAGAACTRVLVIDEVGALAELYRIGDVAYIGGAFSTGVHNVMEPAIMGMPVAFGPFYYNSPEAEELIKLNCAFSGHNENDFEHIFKNFVSNKDQTKKLGEQARGFIMKNLGADERYCTELLKLIGVQ